MEARLMKIYIALLIVLIISPGVYWVLNPEKTQMQVFLEFGWIPFVFSVFFAFLFFYFANKNP